MTTRENLETKPPPAPGHTQVMSMGLARHDADEDTGHTIQAPMMTGQVWES